ncbi:cyclophilin family peptidyl-prolyl cis-trans isomerase [Paenibacillus rhizosphaerae]|uniref:Peptidyl-prolyl cis-trans isomerase n=1 Tax=Paenibacillus rhizosphaerae TaxID=297318 RepID=A0A839TV45_9BACL|nr:peptidylprolyl isomerase [Paenibacillus rhizosphaerae]MBB3130381.1 cyclophilin family peptidyl-prolyl cis-trans isomerase [Paenibacillus rhizosphaerae]
MKLKTFTLPLVLVLTAALALGGCGKKNSDEDASKDTSGGQTTEQTTDQTSGNSSSSDTAGSDSTTDGSTSASGQQQKSWTSPPAMQIDQNKKYEAEVKTSKGTFTIELFAKDAPKTVNNFVFLSKEGFYNGVVFHRIIETFMVQTGDPTGTGSGGPGYSFEDEKTNYKYEPGIVAMANAGPDTNGSQFFICTGADSDYLNQQPNYTIFGKVTKGMDVVMQIAKTPVTVGPSGEESTPTEKVTIDGVTITEK